MTDKHHEDVARFYLSFFVTLGLLGLVAVVAGVVFLVTGHQWGVAILAAGIISEIACAALFLFKRRGIK
ncbi:hypothetical protein [Cryobacterium zhongshanensis]|uniref:Uncharacterized protein n=1 Tax=Cryobacterium zhongshanensis TaxID=2928153 RepID=A0AA41QV93_9MICO|nr:hypothetical protein [Cryobacterium zhongshanensis]MCI4658079.1 hypothetical protein [Cryobacterium zhongshanensis]